MAKSRLNRSVFTAALCCLNACSTGSDISSNSDDFPNATTTLPNDTHTATNLPDDDDDNDDNTLGDDDDDDNDDGDTIDPTDTPSTTSSTDTTSSDTTATQDTTSSTPTTSDTLSDSTTTSGTSDTTTPDTTSSSTESHDTGEQTPLWLIDDFEDGDDIILAVDGRIGAWYTYNDGSTGGTQTPAAGKDVKPGSATGSGHGTLVARTFGSGFKDWGAGIGFDLNNSGNKKEAYNGSAFVGVRFLARTNEAQRVRVAIETMGVVPTEEGGTCVEKPAGMDSVCLDTHGVFIELDNQWRNYEVYFDEVEQEGWGTAVGFDAKQLTGVQFSFEINKAFDFSIDDVVFITP